jgi:ATP-dependent Lon protease
MHMLEPLRNRLEIISIPSYTIQEKLSIAHQYLTKKVWNDHGLNQHSINISDDVMINIIKGYCYYEGGVRELRRSL